MIVFPLFCWIATKFRWGVVANYERSARVTTWFAVGVFLTVASPAEFQGALISGLIVRILVCRGYTVLERASGGGFTAEEEDRLWLLGLIICFFVRYVVFTFITDTTWDSYTVGMIGRYCLSCFAHPKRAHELYPERRISFKVRGKWVINQTALLLGLLTIHFIDPSRVI